MRVASVRVAARWCAVAAPASADPAADQLHQVALAAHDAGRIDGASPPPARDAGVPLIR